MHKSYSFNLDQKANPHERNFFISVYVYVFWSFIPHVYNNIHCSGLAKLQFPKWPLQAGCKNKSVPVRRYVKKLNFSQPGSQNGFVLSSQFPHSWQLYYLNQELSCLNYPEWVPSHVSASRLHSASWSMSSPHFWISWESTKSCTAAKMSTAKATTLQASQ